MGAPSGVGGVYMAAAVFLRKSRSPRFQSSMIDSGSGGLRSGGHQRRLRRQDHGKSGGEGGIRTHGRVSPTLAFEASSFNRSDTSPWRV
jgi:hypothetical protein